MFNDCLNKAFGALPVMSVENLDISRSALLAIDLQNAFCHPDGTLGISGVDVSRAGAIAAPLRYLAKRFREAGRPVFWTLQEHLAIDFRRGRKTLANHTSKRKQIAAIAGSWDAAFVDEVADIASAVPENIIRKHRFGAFHETRLQIMLEMHGISALFIAGATTNACVETTIREAYLRDYDVIAIDDCIAGVRPEWESTAKAVWKQYFAILTDAQEVHGWIDAQCAPRARRLDGVEITVSDMPKARSFYIDLLGLAPAPGTGPDDLIVTREGISLRQGEPQGAVSLTLAVRNVDGLAERLRNAGVEIVQDWPDARAFVARDGDGNILTMREAGA